jgi:uncharacterized membrane protein YdjX (TVP38/TMEM64 family)
MQTNSKKQILINTIIVLILGLVLVKVYWPELVLLFHPSAVHQAQLISIVHHHQIMDIILLITVIAVLCSIPGAPNSVVCIFTGACFGPLGGFLINWCGNILGNGFVLTLVHHSGVTDRFRHRRAFTYLSRQRYPLLGLIMGFSVPIIPNLLVNCVATVLKIPKQNYFLAVSLGTLPIAFLYAYGGHALFSLDIKKLILVITIFILLCVLYGLIKILRKKQAQKR